MLFFIAGAQACVLVFSTTDRESFQAIDSWREKVEAPPLHANGFCTIRLRETERTLAAGANALHFM